MCKIFLLVLLVALFTKFIKSNVDCEWDFDKDLPDRRPPFLYDPLMQKILRPVKIDDERRILRVGYNTELLVSCPSSSITVLGEESALVFCHGGKELRVGDQVYRLQNLGCSGEVSSLITKSPLMGRCGSSKNGIWHSIGFRLDQKHFYESIRICFDHLYETTLYTYHIIRGENLAAQDTGPRPSFKADTGLFTSSPNNLYTISAQKKLMEDILNKNIIDEKRQLFLSRGHLSPDADFVLQDEAESTYFYLNTVPQWQSINNGNWKMIESSIRKMAQRHRSDITIWTGTFDVLSLPDINNNDVLLYLGLSDDSDPQTVIPVPRILWKIAYDAKRNAGVAFASVNDPFSLGITHSSFKCDEVCEKISWIEDFDSDVTKGRSFCCSVQALKKAIPNVPDLGDCGLLTD